MKELTSDKEIFVDASCIGNPGVIEYRGVNEKRDILFYYKFPYGTNNIAEYLAIYRGVEYINMKFNGRGIVWTDSLTALSWVRQRRIKTSLERNEITELLFQEIERAIIYLNKNTLVRILFWETKAHGEIPADFGRKQNYIYGNR